MSDHALVEALQARDPNAIAAVYDAYADPLYAYCWFQLTTRSAAREALRDTLIVAEAHIGRLRDFERLGPWLYALARIECARWMSYGRRSDMPVASHDQDDVDQRIMAWRAVMGLAPLSREAMELRVRHRLSMPDLAAVLGMSVREVKALLDQARAELEAALMAEVLAHEGPYDCPGRTEILRARGAELTPDLRARLLEHALDCEVCGAHQQGTVSAAKVYGMLPMVRPPDSLRLRVLGCFQDPQLTGYRFFVAARVGDFGGDGFPAQPRRTLPSRRLGGGMAITEPGWTYRHRVVLATTAGILVSVLALSLVPLFGRSVDRAARPAVTGAAPSPPVRSGPPVPSVTGPPAAAQDEGAITPVPAMFTLPGGAGPSGPAPLSPSWPPVPGEPRANPPRPRPTRTEPSPRPPGHPRPTPSPSSPCPSPSPTSPTPSPTSPTPPPTSPPPSPGPSDPAPGPSAAGARH